MTLHKELALANLHAIHTWAVADATARTALAVAATDIGKIAWQQDDNSIWFLVDDSPMTWEQLNGAGGGGAVDSVNGQTGVVVLDADDIDDAATVNKFATAAELALIASALQPSVIIDEDNMASDLDTKVPTQQSVKAYVDAAVLASGSYTDEQAQDAVGGILTDSSSIDFTYDDTANTITAAVILEWLQDAVAAMLTGGSHTAITATYQDATGVIDLAASGGSSETYPPTRRSGAYLATSGTTTPAVIAMGLSAPTNTGLAIIFPADSGGPLIEYKTAATAGNSAGLQSPSNHVSATLEPDLGIICKTGATITDIRYWIGFASTSLAAVSGETATAVASFRYDTGVDGTAFWRCITDKVPGTAEVTTTTVAVAADTRYRFRITVTTTEVKFYINDTLVATHSTIIPGSSDGLMISCTVTALAAAERSLRIGAIYIEHKG